MMKKILTALAVLGFIFFFAAASASDAGAIAFEWILLMIGAGAACLLISWTGFKKLRLKGERNTPGHFVAFEEPCVPRKAG